MTTNTEPVFVDTNILIFANAQQAPLHDKALSVIESLWENDVDLWISRQILREYLAAFTRPQEFSRRQPASRLIPHVRFFQEQFRIAEDGPKVTERLLHLLSTIPLGGKQIHDANIVATMQAYGIRRLLTHNVSDFTRFSAYITVLPLESVPL